MYEMALEAAEFIATIPLGTGQPYDREAHRQHLVKMASKYPGVGWEEAILEWDRHVKRQVLNHQRSPR